MCGIAGYIGFDDVRLLRAMCASLTHRGPDQDGFYTAPGVGLSMRRLSVIDLVTGKQPITNEAGDVWVVFNGEIYNYTDLTDDLKRRGHLFRTTSDTETIVHLYEEYGLDFVQHLRGMFGIALWDERRKRLVLARDRIGEKPLYYSCDGARLLFGSEAKAILQHPAERRVDPAAVCEFLACGYVPGSTTFYQHIRKLPPGHILVHEQGEVTVRQYWRLERKRDGLSFADASDQLRELLSDIVRRCLKSDVEVGVFLSGGLDSSLIVALMAEHGVRPHSFTVGYDSEVAGFNELDYAAQVARTFSREHHELTISGRSSVDLLPRVLWQFDEPHGEPTSILVYLLCEFTRRHLKVALGGTGGDELFFGYPRHKGIRYLQYYRLLPRVVRKHLVERVLMKWPESTAGSRFAKRARRFVTGSDLPPAEAYLSWVSLLHRETRAGLVSAAVTDGTSDPTGEAALREYLTAPVADNLYDRAAALDVGGYLPEYQLTYMDRMSMAHGLEVRSPLCDYRLAEFALSLPPAYRLKGSRSKYILKEVARQWLPRSITDRKKVGFDSPIGHWIKTELREFMQTFLSREHVERSGLLSYDGVHRVLSDHLSGRRDYSLQLWSILALEAWHRMYIEDGLTDIAGYSIRNLRGAEAVPVETAPAASTQSVPLAAVNGHSTPRRLHTRKHVWEALPPTARESLGRALSVVPLPVLLGGKFRRTLRFARRSQWWSAEQARAYQLGQVRRICMLACEHSAFYRRHFDQAGLDPASLRSLDQLRRLPTINKDTLRTHLRDMSTRGWPPTRADYVSTGGTGGTPLCFYIDADRAATEFAYLIATWERAGYKLGDAVAVLRGNALPARRDGMHYAYDPLLRHHRYSSFHMSDEHLARYTDHMCRTGELFMHAYPSTAAAVVRFLKRTGATPPPIKAVLTESEILYPEQRRMIEQVLGCRCFSAYGHTEKLVLAGGCEKSDLYHVWPTYGYFELLDADGRPVTKPGQTGEIVGTGFINTVTPFIRYRTGDYAAYAGDRCDACGRIHPALKDIRGHRTQEMLVARDGAEISWTALNMHDDTFENVHQFQFYQDRPGRAVLRIVPAAGFGPTDVDRVRRNMGRKLEGQLDFTVSIEHHILRTLGGKAVYVDQRIASLDLSGGNASAVCNSHHPIVVK